MKNNMKSFYCEGRRLRVHIDDKIYYQIDDAVHLLGYGNRNHLIEKFSQNDKRIGIVTHHDGEQVQICLTEYAMALASFYAHEMGFVPVRNYKQWHKDNILALKPGLLSKVLIFWGRLT